MKKLMIIASSAFLMSLGVANAQVEDQETQTPSTQYQEGVESSDMEQDTLQQSNEFNQDTDAVTPDATTPAQDETVSPETQPQEEPADNSDAIKKDDELDSDGTSDESIEN
jgi:type IV secretory pathway VirB10-like protein